MQRRDIANLKWTSFLYPRGLPPNAAQVSSGGLTVRRACLATCTYKGQSTRTLSFGASASPIDVSFGRIRVRIAAIHSLNPSMSKILKSSCLNSSMGGYCNIFVRCRGERFPKQVPGKRQSRPSMSTTSMAAPRERPREEYYFGLLDQESDL